ncbi:hypothetical protein [Clostridium estertheticum]|uniref:Uncharacterized protein n=1 Tax=Clostridium estertheticum TaxID=238834 RepID=A0AA47EQA1_9CLOT|nr:hypothetical protein [Clostridium estertheticum]MBU3157628.1 hypothetical protein [Clostridium estertheticum]WAG63246.1 hypothetical protein LL038_24780 [Clostridium estertheticum]
MIKMDEMEKEFTLKSIRVSWFLTGIFLFGWGIKNYIYGLGNTLPMVLFTSQVTIALISKYIYTIKADDKESKNSLIKLIIIALLIILAGCLLYYFKIGF